MGLDKRTYSGGGRIRMLKINQIKTDASIPLKDQAELIKKEIAVKRG